MGWGSGFVMIFRSKILGKCERRQSRPVWEHQVSSAVKCRTMSHRDFLFPLTRNNLYKQFILPLQRSDTNTTLRVDIQSKLLHGSKFSLFVCFTNCARASARVGGECLRLLITEVLGFGFWFFHVIAFSLNIFFAWASCYREYANNCYTSTD